MTTSRKRKAVLLVGDSFFIPIGFANLLQKHGYDILSIGSEGSEILMGTRMKPEIVLVDYEMQHNDPLRATAILHSALPSSYIAVMNGLIKHCDQTKARSAGARKILSRRRNAMDYESILHGIEEEVYL